MISYKIAHHIPGRIRIEIPALKKISIALLKNMAAIPIPDGILDISPNPFTGSIVILYEPNEIDIVEYIRNMAASSEIQKIIGG
jgi:hypothetical protein